ncbi:hypothetical protein [Pedobacter sp.]|uniref:hypothetical protein n=1 Tax=Pedobacter sp. TaxID=1411316 RepID=UPI00396CF62A
MRNIYSLFFALLLIMLCQCRNKEALVISNDSNGSIYYFYSPAPYVRPIDSLFLGGLQLKKLDTLSYNGRIPPKTIMELPLFGSWEKLIDEEYGGKITFFFFSVPTLRNHTWNEIVNRQLYESKKTFTSEDLKKLNWKIGYP